MWPPRHDDCHDGSGGRLAHVDQQFVLVSREPEVGQIHTLARRRPCGSSARGHIDSPDLSELVVVGTVAGPAEHRDDEVRLRRKRVDVGAGL